MELHDVYEHKVDKRDELLQQIFNAARLTNGTTVLHKVTLSTLK